MPLLHYIRLLLVPKYLRKAFKIANSRPVDIRKIQAFIEQDCKEKPLKIFSDFNQLYTVAKGNINLAHSLAIPSSNIS